MSQRTWTWDLGPDHWIDLALDERGLGYVGTDWSCQSGGGYTAGYQTIDQFLRDGGTCKMPDEIAAEVRAAIAALPTGGLVEIRLAGAEPEQAHLDLDGQPILLDHPGSRLFDGHLPAGPHRLAGVLLYPGRDRRGRRNARTFELDFEVIAGRRVTLEITETAPRWPADEAG